MIWCFVIVPPNGDLQFCRGGKICQTTSQPTNIYIHPHQQQSNLAMENRNRILHCHLKFPGCKKKSVRSPRNQPPMSWVLGGNVFSRLTAGFMLLSRTWVEMVLWQSDISSEPHLALDLFDLLDLLNLLDPPRGWTRKLPWAPSMRSRILGSPVSNGRCWGLYTEPVPNIKFKTAISYDIINPTCPTIVSIHLELEPSRKVPSIFEFNA